MGASHQEISLWFGKGRWKKRRAAQLAAHPLCRLCLEHHGVVTPATVADHVKPHHGDRREFEFGKLQSLCTACHESAKRTIENRGYSVEVGLDGWPVDRNHPCYVKRRQG